MHVLICVPMTPGTYSQELACDVTVEPRLRPSAGSGGSILESVLGVRGPALMEDGNQIPFPGQCLRDTRPFYLLFENGKHAVFRLQAVFVTASLLSFVRPPLEIMAGSYML